MVQAEQKHIHCVAALLSPEVRQPGRCLPEEALPGIGLVSLPLAPLEKATHLSTLFSWELVCGTGPGALLRSGTFVLNRILYKEGKCRKHGSSLDQARCFSSDHIFVLLTFYPKTCTEEGSGIHAFLPLHVGNPANCVHTTPLY